MKLSTTQTLGPLVIEAGYFSGNNITGPSATILEYLEGVGCHGYCHGYLVLFSVSILRVVLSVGIDFDWKRNKEGK